VAIMLLRGETSWSGPTVALATCSAMLNAAAGLRADRVLSWTPLAWIGIVSYSIYLLHILVIGAFGRLGLTSDLAMLGALVVTVAAASLSYGLIEKPFRRLGKHLARRVATRPAVLAGEGRMS